MCTPDLNTTVAPKPVAEAPEDNDVDESIYSEEVNLFTLNSSDGKCVTFRICGSGSAQTLTVMSPEPVTVKLDTFEDLVNNMLDPSDASCDSPEADDSLSQAHTCSHNDHCKLHEVYVLQGMTYAFVMVTLALLILSYLQVMRIRCEA